MSHTSSKMDGNGALLRTHRRTTDCSDTCGGVDPPMMTDGEHNHFWDKACITLGCRPLNTTVLCDNCRTPNRVPTELTKLDILQCYDCGTFIDLRIEALKQ